MSRKILSLGVLAAAFTLVLGTADAQAGHCRSDRSYRNCRQHNHCGYQQATICGHQQVANYGCQQTQQVSYVTTNTCCAPRATCCSAQPTCATSGNAETFSVPQPPVEQAAPAPAPGT